MIHLHQKIESREIFDEDEVEGHVFFHLLQEKNPHMQALNQKLQPPVTEGDPYNQQE